VISKLPTGIPSRPSTKDGANARRESSHALIRRGLIGIYHNVSREYLYRYLWQFDFLWMLSARLQPSKQPKESG
jgi:hypothetical protein